MTPLTVSYYTDEVARGVEDYYAGCGEAEGVWVGAGAAHEKLRGSVDAGALSRLFDGRHPRTGESLGAPYKVADSVDRVTGWDLTFSAPKSVSVVWAVGGGAIGMDVRDAHEAAVRAALCYLEDHAAFSRTGKAGVRQVDTQGLVGAAFVHRTSRVGDPQLHTHVLVSSRVRCDDGVWRALDSRALHRQLKPAGMVYQAALRAELTRRLGVEWTAVDRNGQAEIVAVPVGLRRLFGQRRTAVEAEARHLIRDLEERHGRALTPAERRSAFERAVLDTRDAKHHDAETDLGLHDRWLAEATRGGLAPASWIGDTLDRAEPHELAVEFVAADIVVELTAAQSTWRRADAVRAAARHAPTGGDADATRAWIERTSDAVLADPRVVALRVPDVDPPAGLVRRDGGSVFDRHDATRYTTFSTLAVEQRVIGLAERGRNAGRGVATSAAVANATHDHQLSADQAEVVRAVSLDGDTVVCVVGPAGSGKSRAMRAAADAWTASAIQVRGLAVSAVAAGVLAKEAQVRTDTVAKFLFEHDRPAGAASDWRLHRGEVVVVDEAGMISTADLARLAQLIDAARGKLVLVGDHAQLGAVDAGGLFRLLAEQHAVDLTGVRRFTQRWERDASLRLRARDPSVVAVYEQHGRVQSSDRIGVIDTAAREWLQARAAGESLVVTAADNATVSAICDRVRAARVAAGEVEPDGILAHGPTVGVGDEIVTLRNDRTLATSARGWVRNGDRWQVTARNTGGSLTVSHLGGHGRTILPADYVADHVQLAYALTTHKAQGVTVDRALAVVNDATTAEALYVAMTRGRHDNTALVCVDALDVDHREPPAAAREVLAAAVGRVAAEHAALAALRDTLAASDSLAVLAPRLANINAHIERETPDNPDPELQRLAARRAYLDQRSSTRITRAGRETRHARRDLDQQIAQLEAARTNRQRWFDDHAHLFAYRDHLAQQVDARRDALAVAASVEQPAHLVELLGPIGGDDTTRVAWMTLAGRVEAYREQWGIDPDRLRDPPIDGVQHREWTSAVRTLELIERLDRAAERALHRGIDRGIGIEL